MDEGYKNSPGVGVYDPKKEAVLTKSPSVAKMQEDRFRWLGCSKEAHIPLVYEADIETKLKRHGVLMNCANNRGGS